jgi:hypothetical protein
MRCCSFLIVDRMALSMAFWSAARLLDGFFFCPTVRDALYAFFDVESHLWLLALLEELLLSLLLVCLLLSKVLLPSHLVNLRLVNAGQIDLLRRGDNIAGVDSSEGNTVDLERASNKKDTL